MLLICTTFQLTSTMSSDEEDLNERNKRRGKKLMKQEDSDDEESNALTDEQVDFDIFLLQNVAHTMDG